MVQLGICTRWAQPEGDHLHAHASLLSLRVYPTRQRQDREWDSPLP